MAPIARSFVHHAGIAIDVRSQSAFGRPEHAQKIRPLILVVDDTPIARTVLRHALEEPGYDVIEAGSTQDAIRAYRDEWPDVVTMDILMDGHNGIVAIQALRRIDPKALIIVCSATSDKSFVTGAVTLGVEAYLNKPIDSERLLAVVAKALAKSREQRETPN
jgi:two-component system chemotaxis response regulator CheY